MSFFQRALMAAAAVAMLSVAGQVSAQIPDEFTNLKVLPEDISKRELVSIMRKFAGALGKRCNYCHVGDNPHSLEGYDFESDEKEPKRVARIMMKMTNEINNTHLPELERENVIRVRCVTCHNGISKPETIDNVVLAEIEKEGIDAGLATYRELREEYYGRAAYDFGSGPLNSAAEQLAASDDISEAIAIMQMNIEFNPDQAYLHIFLGRLHEAAGDRDAAITSLERGLELDPGNEWARGLLEKMKAGD